MADKAYAEINGILVTDVKLIPTEKGYVAKFHVVVNRDSTGEKDEFNMTAWNQIAENCSTYLKKGSYVRTKCKVENRPFANGKLYATEFIVNHIKFEDEEEKYR